MPEEYKAEIAHILYGSEPLEIVEQVNPTSHGWLRRPDYDRDDCDAWERPDGTLCGIARPRPAEGRSPDGLH